MTSVRMFVAMALFAAAFPVPARDVASEQSAVQYARQEYEKLEAEHKADVAQAAITRKAFEQVKKQYEAEQKKANLSEKRKQQAKAKLDRAQEALDRAWKQ